MFKELIHINERNEIKLTKKKKRAVLMYMCICFYLELTHVRCEIDVSLFSFHSFYFFQSLTIDIYAFVCFVLYLYAIVQYIQQQKK